MNLGMTSCDISVIWTNGECVDKF